MHLKRGGRKACNSAAKGPPTADAVRGAARALAAFAAALEAQRAAGGIDKVRRRLAAGTVSKALGPGLVEAVLGAAATRQAALDALLAISRLLPGAVPEDALPRVVACIDARDPGAARAFSANRVQRPLSPAAAADAAASCGTPPLFLSLDHQQARPRRRCRSCT